MKKMTRENPFAFLSLARPDQRNGIIGLASSLLPLSPSPIESKAADHKCEEGGGGLLRLCSL